MPGRKNTRGKASGAKSDNYKRAAADYKEFSEALLRYLNYSLEACAKNMAKSVMTLVAENLKQSGRYAGRDEEIFNCHNEILNGYKSIAAKYENGATLPDDVRVGEILAGVCKVLASQINQHEEYMGEQCYKDLAKVEKERFVKELFASIAGMFKSININNSLDINEAAALCRGISGGDTGEINKKCLKHIYGNIINAHGRHIYKLYTDTVLERAANIPFNKSFTDYFYESLKQEEENLNGIVCVQVSALKEDMAELDENAPYMDIINEITCLYEKARGHTENIESFLKERHKTKHEPVSYDDFVTVTDSALNELISAADKYPLNLVSSWKTAVNRLNAVLTVIASDFYKGLARSVRQQYKSFIYEARKSASDKIILANEMAESFNELKAMYEKCLSAADISPDTNIISGIHESVCLKLDILKESKETFEKAVEEKISAFTLPDLNGDEKSILSDKFFDEWYACAAQLNVGDAAFEATVRQKTDDLIKEAIQNTPGCECILNTEKKIEKEKSAVKKLESEYLKDYVLYEVRTFEEILMYSVTKLKESTNEISVKYADKCESVQSFVTDMLKRHDIYLISPQQHTFFDSKEHEVLVAEKNDEYQKGQIIKLMNSGYKYKDMVLVRANVIAAK